MIIDHEHDEDHMHDDDHGGHDDDHENEDFVDDIHGQNMLL